MRLTELERLQSSNVSEAIQKAEVLLESYKDRRVSQSLWFAILAILFPVILPHATRSAELSRRFYDEERERVFPGIPRHDFYLAELEFDQFVSDMSESFQDFHKKHTEDHELHRALLRVAQSVENTGRYTTIKALRTHDPWLDGGELEVTTASREESERRRSAALKRKGKRLWARVATGKETCGWCLMLCSRGPVYSTEDNAGGKNAWHPGCDCKIVPVFDLTNWTGRDRYKAAEEMWKKETVGYYGRDAINAMRRAAADGKFQEYLAQKS